MSFNPTIVGVSLTTSISLMGNSNSTDPIQSSSTSFSGKTVAHLPADDNNSKVSGVISKVITDNFMPVYYQGYYHRLYCSYDEIISAIESWGKVEAILMSDGGLNHTFIVSFKKPIKCSYDYRGVKVNLYGSDEISDTPFKLRRCFKDPVCGNAILSSTSNIMAFDIPCLKVGYFPASYLWKSQKLLPDERLSKIKEVDGGKTKEMINDIFSESNRAKKLLEWIEKAGLEILNRGLFVKGSNCCNRYSVDEIVKEYTTLKCDNPWKVVMQAVK